MEFSFEVPQDAREMPPSVGPDFVPIDAHVRVHGHFDSTLNCFVFFTGRSQLKKTKSLFKDLLISSWLKNTQFDSWQVFKIPQFACACVCESSCGIPAIF